MKDYQARGYIFESVIWKLLKRFGYINVTTGNIRGRGAEHQIDACGLLSIPTAFLYQIRLLCECKCYKTKIELEKIRNFVGVIKDISENYFVSDSHTMSAASRFTDVGCFFSASEYTLDAQEYAWAHNIFLVSFYQNSLLRPIIDDIFGFVSRLSYAELNNATKSSIVELYWRYKNENTTLAYFIKNEDEPSIAMGILDGKYPVALVGESNWLFEIDELKGDLKETIHAYKSERIEYETETAFHLNIEQKKVVFSLPNVIASRIISIIENSNNGDMIFYIDVPYRKIYENEALRRFIKIEVHLPGEQLIQYKEKIKSIQTHNIS